MKRNVSVEAPGFKFGRWKVIRVFGRSSDRKKIMLECVCECGNIGVISKSDLMHDVSTSCGCFKRENTSSIFRQRSPKDAAKRNHYKDYKSKSKSRGREFSLDEDEFFDVTSRPCWYCGREPVECMDKLFGEKAGTGYIRNGIDRIDNSVGYVTGNVVPCCSMCNRSKNKFSYEEFINMCVNVARIHGGA